MFSNNTVSSQEAVRIIREIERVAVENSDQPVAIAVMGHDFGLIAFWAMDSVLPISRKLAIQKAYTALVGSRDTLYWERQEKEGKLVGRNFVDPDFTCFGGGIVILENRPDGQIVGAIGVSGRNSSRVNEDEPPQDHELARIGLQVFDYFRGE